MRPLGNRVALVVVVAATAGATATLATVAPGCGKGSAHDVPDGSTAVSAGQASQTSVAVCHAPQRPSGATVVALQDAFPNLPAFSVPVGVTQAPGDADHFYVWQ